MRNVIRHTLMLAMVFLLSYGYGHAQLSGTYSIAPSGANTYVSLAAAIADLNTSGVNGSVTINVPAGYTEFAPTGGFVLGSAKLSTGANSLTASRTLTIRKNGAGANPMLSSTVGTSLVADGIFKIAGASYVTIDGISLRDTNNVSPTTMMEWGYALVKLNSGSIYGCNKVAIKHANIKLNINNGNSAGIYVGKCIATDTVALSYSTTDAASSFNDFIADTINNVHRGIQLNGLATTSGNLDKGYRLDSNAIQNFGSLGSTTIVSAGIYILGSSDDSIRYNVIDNTAGGGTSNMKAITYGLFHGAAIAGSARISNNNITIVQDSTALTSAFYMIRTEIGGTPASGTPGAYANTLEIKNNTLSLRGGRGAGAFRIISHSGPLNSEIIAGNTFKDINYNGSAVSYFIDNTNVAPAGSIISIHDNVYSGSFRWVPITTTGGGMAPTLYGCNNTGASVGTTAQPVRDSIYNNSFSMLAAATTGSGQAFQIIKDDNGSATSYPVKYIANNTISITGFRVTGVNVTRLGNDRNAPSYIINNTIRNMVTLSSGIGVTDAAGQKADIYGNVIDSVYSPSLGGITGISVGSGTFNIYNNKISRLSTGVAPTIVGLNIGGNDTVLAYNNIISGLTTSAVANDRGVIGINAASTGVLSLYHNTIHLASDDPTDTLDHSVTGVYYGNILDKLDMRNNIIYVAAAPIKGIAAAVRRSAGTQGTVPSNLAVTTDGNIYHTIGLPKNYVYTEGTDTLALVNSYIDTVTFNKHCSDYHVFMSPREQASYVEDNLSMIGTTNTYAPTGASYAKQRAVATSPVVANDYSGAVRPTAPDPADIGALQFTGTVKQPPVLSVTASGATTFCKGDSVKLSTTADTSVTYQWYNAGVMVSGATDSTYTSKDSGTYILVTTTKNSSCTDTSDVITVIANPLPVPVITTSGTHNDVLTTSTYTTYQWNRDGQPVSGGTSQSYTATQDGSYTVTVTDGNGCAGTSAAKQVTLPGGVAGVAGISDLINIFPNPASDIIRIKAPIDVMISVLGIDGRVVLQQQHAQQVNVSNLAHGIYVVRVYDNDGNMVKVEKLVIDKP